MIHLAHVTGWALDAILDLPIGELHDWIADSVAYWNRMHASPNE